MFKRLKTLVSALFLLSLAGTILFSCKNENKKSNNFEVEIDKVIVKDTIYIIDTICPDRPAPVNIINDSLMLEYIKVRNKNVIEKIKNSKGIIFNEKDLEKFKNY